MKLLLWLLCAFCVFCTVVVSPVLAANETYVEIRSDYQRLVKSAQLQRQRNNWEKLIKRFVRFVENNPDHEDASRASFLEAKTWDGLSRAAGSKPDARKAIDRYLAMANTYAASTLADDALFHAGQLAEKRLQDTSAAWRYYSKLVRQHPDSDMVADARARLADLPQPAVEPARRSKPVAVQAKSAATKPRLENIRHWSESGSTRVVLDLSAATIASPHLLRGNKPRLYFDLERVQLGSGLLPEVSILDGRVQRVRASQFDRHNVRVVIDLYSAVDYQLTTMENPHRIVVDIGGRAAAGRAANSAPAGSDDSIASILGTASTAPPVLHIPQQRKGDGLRLIVVDAGHGGRDPGAVGPGKVLEKTVTLELAKRLADKLRKQLGVKVLLSRSKDEYIELRDRTAFANRVGADLFISLHANANNSRKAYGLESYFLNLSKNNQAAEVAARENGTSLQDVSNLEAILFDLMANAKINESSRLAAEVQQAMVSGLRPHYSKIKDLGVKQGPFHVLLGATMPSVLIEAAFISNRREEKRLTSRDYQERVAAAIVRGVKNYATTIDRVARR